MATDTRQVGEFHKADARRRRLFSLGRAAVVCALILGGATLAGLCRPTAPAQAGELAATAMTPSLWPVQGTVTSGFGWRTSPFGEGNEQHAGVDIAVSLGTPVVATADGEVVESGPVGDYGNMVQVDHGNGLATVYGHNSRLAVTAGQTVLKGQVIAYAGSTGKSTGPHVHYEVRKDGVAVDPWRFLVAY